MSQIINYLDYAKKNYTLDITSNYEYVLIAQINRKTIDNFKNKKIIFITHLIEQKLYNSLIKKNKKDKEFKKKLFDYLNTCFIVITSLESLKK